MKTSVCVCVCVCTGEGREEGGRKGRGKGVCVPPRTVAYRRPHRREVYAYSSTILYQAKQGLSHTIEGPPHRRLRASSEQAPSKLLRASLLHVEPLLRRPRRLEQRDESIVFAVAVAIVISP